MFTDVEIKWKKKNKILFSWDSQCLQELIQRIQEQNHKTIVLWALDCAKITLEQFESKYKNEQRPRKCLEQCRDWAQGTVKMSVAKQAILACHAVAKEINDPQYEALCHAIGQAGSTVHVGTHALGLPFYELTAIVLHSGKNQYYEPVINKIQFYLDCLCYWQENTDKIEMKWASFLNI